MKWQKIEKELPLAWETLVYYYTKDLYNNDARKYVGVEWVETMIQDRCLYDFFDEQGLFVEIGFGYESKLQKITWDYGITPLGFDYQTDWDINFKTRPEAETAAFEKAFEILEKQIVSKK